MKTKNLLFVFLGMILLGACTVGANKDLMSGLKITNSGLSYKEAYMSRQNVKLNTSEYSMGDTIYLYMDGIEGYTLKDDKAYVGASLTVTDQSGAKLGDYPDLFSANDSTGFSKEDAAVIALNIKVKDPFKPGEKYTWKSKIWDKNGKGEINAEVEFTVK